MEGLLPGEKILARGHGAPFLRGGSHIMLQKEAIWSRFKICTQNIGFTESKASREFKCVSGEDAPNSSITSLVGV